MPLRRVAAVLGVAVAVSVTPGSALPGQAMPPLGDETGESNPDLGVQPTPFGTGTSRVFPVRGATSYASAHHDYPATDIFADCGTPVVAPITGTVLEVSRVDRWDPSTDRPRYRGGKYFSIAGHDGIRYYGSHLRSLAGRIQAGVTVHAGEPVGRVGRSGNAAYTSCHLHFGLGPECSGRADWWVRRGVVSPYRFLRSWENGGDRSPRAATTSWQHHHGCRPADVFG
jgi:murein DD-endopeptidase MepM/ murein hydrolase activator NlpD